MAIDFNNIRLGKKAAVFDPRTLKMAKYLAPDLPPPPSIVDWSATISDFGMMGNNNCGDCTIATCGHQLMIWTLNNGNMKVIPDSAIIAAYAAVSGYNPRTGANDNGANCLEVLKYWSQTGIGGNRLQAFGEIDRHDLTAVQQSVYLFGGVYIGVSLPASARGQSTWDVRGPVNQGIYRPGTWGGHAINIVAYDRIKKVFVVVSWGHLIEVEFAFFAAYCDEAYACLSNDWLTSGNVAPNAIDIASLQDDLGRVRGAA